VYAPVEFGGLGVKDLEVQTTTMRVRDAIRVFQVDKNEYFLSKYTQVMRKALLANMPQSNQFYENIRLKLNQIRFRLLNLSQDVLGTIGVQNTCVFPNLDCEQLLELGLSDVDSVLNWDGNATQLSAAKSRKLHYSLQNFNKQLQDFHKECEPVAGKKAIFRCDCPIRELGSFKDRIYAASFFGVYRADGISNEDMGKMKWKKWDNIGNSWMANYEKDVSWRLWHNSLLSFSLAMRMGLVTDSNCPFCEVSRPSSFHMVHCVSTKDFWTFVFGLIRKTGIMDKCDKLNGFVKNKLGDFFIYLSHSVLYNRTLYYVNSGKKEYDLISVFKQKIIERLVIEYNCVFRNKNTLEIFLDKWNQGVGLFHIQDNQILFNI
jgi:hypothetical protein